MSSPTITCGFLASSIDCVIMSIPPTTTTERGKQLLLDFIATWTENVWNFITGIQSLRKLRSTTKQQYRISLRWKHQVLQIVLIFGTPIHVLVWEPERITSEDFLQQKTWQMFNWGQKTNDTDFKQVEERISCDTVYQEFSIWILLINIACMWRNT